MSKAMFTGIHTTVLDLLKDIKELKVKWSVIEQDAEPVHKNFGVDTLREGVKHYAEQEKQAYYDRCIKRIEKLGSVNGIRGIVGKGTVLKILSEELENQKTK